MFATNRHRVRYARCSPREEFGSKFPLSKHCELLAFGETVRDVEVATDFGTEGLRWPGTGVGDVLRRGSSALAEKVSGELYLEDLAFVTGGTARGAFATPLWSCRMSRRG